MHREGGAQRGWCTERVVHREGGAQRRKDDCVSLCVGVASLEKKERGRGKRTESSDLLPGNMNRISLSAP